MTGRPLSGFDPIKRKDNKERADASTPQSRQSGIDNGKRLVAMMTEYARLARRQQAGTDGSSLDTNTPDSESGKPDSRKDQYNQEMRETREKLRESLRSIVKKYRQEGNLRSTTPDLRNMNEGQILLEVLSKPDWSKKLQEKGIHVNKPTLELISQKLNEMQMKSPKPSDYNPAVRNFNDTLDKFGNKDLAALRVEPAGLRGGIYFHYNDGKLCARFMTLQNPGREEYIFDKGEGSSKIADYTASLREQYANRKTREWAQQGHSLNFLQIEHYKHEYDNITGTKPLTGNDVKCLEEGEIFKGWTCTELTYVPMQESVYFTDNGTPISVLHPRLEAYSQEEHDARFANMWHINIEAPTASYNCHGLTFINKRGWLDDGEAQCIQTILDDNGYRFVDDKDAQSGDIAVYFKNGAIEHTATVQRIDRDQIIVDSKPGIWGRIHHEIRADKIVQGYGNPFIFRTNREIGHTLAEWD